MRRHNHPHPHRGGRRLHHDASPREWPVRLLLNMLLHSSPSNLLRRGKLGLSNCAERFAYTLVACIEVARISSSRFANNGNRPIGSENVVGYGRAIGSWALFSKAHGIIDCRLDPGLYLGLV